MSEKPKEIVIANKHKGPWQPGQSGNPSGRPKRELSIRMLARQYADEAIETLRAHLSNPDGRIAVAAANSILDRAYGRPAQAIHIEADERRKLEAMTDQELLAIATGVAIEQAGRTEVTRES